MSSVLFGRRFPILKTKKAPCRVSAQIYTGNNAAIFALFLHRRREGDHKVLYIKSRVPHCMSPRRQRVYPSPQNRGGGAHSPAGEGLGESQFQRLEKKLITLPTLWGRLTVKNFKKSSILRWGNPEKNKNIFNFFRREEASWGEAGGGGQAEVRPHPGGHEAQHNHQPQGYWGEGAVHSSVFNPPPTQSGVDNYLSTLFP